MDFYAARAIAEHCYLTLARVNGEIDAELKAFRTWRNEQELQEVIVQERYLGVIDKWLDYIDEALEEADKKNFDKYIGLSMPGWKPSGGASKKQVIFLKKIFMGMSTIQNHNSQNRTNDLYHAIRHKQVSLPL